MKNIFELLSQMMAWTFFSESQIYKHKNLSEMSDSINETPRKGTNQIESVHSSSDQREHIKLHHKIEIPTVDEEIDLQEKIYNFLKRWFEVWKGVFLYGDLSQCTIYFPLVSLSAVGSQGNIQSKKNIK